MDRLNQILKNLPSFPGVYQFLNKDGKIIYIGKAKNLKNRVNSYFNKGKYDSYKTKTLSEQVFNIDYIIVETESDALFLENNLIKKYQPKYNILLKDDKTFPWISIKNEPFPRVFSTRRLVNDGSEYFGPYTSALMVKILLTLIRQLYQLRSCSYSLTKENIDRKRYKKCLEFHIGNCKAPCEQNQSKEDYDNSISLIRLILKGNIIEVIKYLKNLMKKFANDYKFEEAEKIKQKIVLLERYKSKSTIVSPKLNNLDVFSIYEHEKFYWINFIKINKGAIIQSHTIEIQKKLDETVEEILLFGIIDIRQKVNSTANEVIVPFRISSEIEGIKFVVPKSGDKYRLLELSKRNARQYFLLKQKTIESDEFENRTTSLLEKVKTDLQLKELPKHIECFDNSNIQGSNPVAACVVFKNGHPAKKEYRHYIIKTVTGADDFASMKEVVFRRYKRLLDENAELPQLVIVDGGKGQLSAAVESLKNLNLYSSIPIIGIAKKLEEIYFPYDSIPIYLNKNSTTLKLIQNLRNEAHRFGISFHRNKRSSAMLKSKLEQIKGIGPVYAQKIIKEFGSVEVIQSIDYKVIENTLGKKVALLLSEELKILGVK
jgi:excinuclease ABC subunit C